MSFFNRSRMRKSPSYPRCQYRPCGSAHQKGARRWLWDCSAAQCTYLGSFPAYLYSSSISSSLPFLHQGCYLQCQEQQVLRYCVAFHHSNRGVREVFEQLSVNPHPLTMPHVDSIRLSCVIISTLAGASPQSILRKLLRTYLPNISS